MARENFELQQSNNIFEEEQPSIHDSFSFSQRGSDRRHELNDEINSDSVASMLIPSAPTETAKTDAYKTKPSVFGPLIFNSAPYGRGGNKTRVPARIF